MVSNVGYMGTPPVINSVSARNIKKPVLDRIIVSVKDERIYFTRGATLIYGLNRTLCEIPGNWRMPHVTGYLVCSVIFNLSLCPQRPIWQTAFPPGSHLPGFSVRAWLLWLPLHRFNLLNLHLIYHRKLYLSTLNFIFNNIFLSLRCCSLRSQ